MTKKKDISTDIAGRQFEFADYKKKDQLSSDLATIHEQVSDGYYEGTIDRESKKG